MVFVSYSNEWDWREKTMFIHTNQPLVTSFYIKKSNFFVELAIIQRWSAIFCATSAWGGKPIGRVRVKNQNRQTGCAILKRKYPFWLSYTYINSSFLYSNISDGRIVNKSSSECENNFDNSASETKWCIRSDCPPPDNRFIRGWAGKQLGKIGIGWG